MLLECVLLWHAVGTEPALSLSPNACLVPELSCLPKSVSFNLGKSSQVESL